MSTELAIMLDKRGIDEELWTAIKSCVYPGSSDESAVMAYDYCKARKLDILKRPCYIVPMNVKDAKTGRYGWRDVIMPGISEHRITANRTGEYAGQDPPVFGEMVEVNIGGEKHTVPEWSTVTVYRMINGERVSCSHTEYFEEACGTTKDGKLNAMWKRRKRGQLAKCAEAGALRKAFPEELGGIITADESQTEMRNVTPEMKRISSQTKPEPLSTLPNPADASPPQEPKPEPSPEPANQPAPAKPKPSKPNSVTRKVQVKEVKSVQGTGKNGKPYTLTKAMLDIGQTQVEATTFSTRVGADVDFLQGQRAVVELEYNPETKATKLLSAVAEDFANNEQEGGIA